MQYTEEMHRAIMESLMETCNQSLVDGPKPGLAATHESEHTNGGYLTMDTLLHLLQRLITGVKPINSPNPANGPLMCGLVDFEESQPFNGSISNINQDLAHYCRLCLRKLNEKASLLGVWDQQEYLPWCIIKHIIMIYYDKFTFKMVGDDTDPFYSTQNRISQRIVLEGIVERVPGGPSTTGDWLISASCSSARVNWMNNLFEEFFIKSGDHIDPTWPGWRGTNNPEEISDFTEEDICRWWANEMSSYIPTNREIWGEFERPQPPDHSPPTRRPVVVEPVNETKKKLTEILAFIEEKREIWTMNEGDYLKISGLMKEAFDSV